MTYTLNIFNIEIQSPGKRGSNPDRLQRELCKPRSKPDPIVLVLGRVVFRYSRHVAI